jgi:copper/silver efflux system protein
VVTADGRRIALQDLAEITIEDGPPGIKSENARLNGWTFVDIGDVDVGTYVRAAQEAVAAGLTLPVGYSLRWSGQYEYMERAKARLLILAPLTLAIIVVLLFANFRRLQEVLIILVTLPLCSVGGLWLLYLNGYNLSVAVGVGFIALAGVAVELGMILLVYLNHSFDDAVRRGEPLDRAGLRDIVIAGAGRRIRPVLMTVTATVAGLLPLLFGTGTGSEVMTRMAAPMVGGMVTAFLLTMLVLPAIYFLWKLSATRY